MDALSGSACPITTEYEEEHGREHREEQIHRDAGERDYYVAALVVPEVRRIDGARLGAAQCDRTVRAREHDDGEKDRHEGVDVLDRVEGQPAELIGCRVPLLERSVRMCPLVRDERKEEHWNGEQNLRERCLIQCDAGVRRWAGGGASARKVAVACTRVKVVWRLDISARERLIFGFQSSPLRTRASGEFRAEYRVREKEHAEVPRRRHS